MDVISYTLQARNVRRTFRSPVILRFHLEWDNRFRALSGTRACRQQPEVLDQNEYIVHKPACDLGNVWHQVVRNAFKEPMSYRKVMEWYLQDPRRFCHSRVHQLG